MSTAAVVVTESPDVLDPTITMHRVACARCGGEWLYAGPETASRAAADHRDQCGSNEEKLSTAVEKSALSASTLVSVSVRTAAELTSLRETFIREAIYRGTLPAHQVGERIVIMPADLRSWVAGHSKVTATSEATS